MNDADHLESLALSNYGHFTSMRVISGRVRGLSRHLDRLDHDASVLFGTTLDRDEVVRRIRAATEDGPAEAVVRITVYDPELDMRKPETAAKPTLLVSAGPAPVAPADPAAIGTLLFERDLPTVKHVGLFGQLWARRQARLAGREDVLFHDAGGRISEGATWNVGLLDGDSVVWPESPCLPGVTAALLSEVLPDTRVAPVRLSDLPSYSGAFLANAVIGIRSIGSVDEHRFPDAGRAVDRVRAAYEGIGGESVTG